jgi:hypothetical protein
MLIAPTKCPNKVIDFGFPPYDLIFLLSLRKATNKDLQSAFRDIASKMDTPKVSPMFGPRVSGRYISDTPSKLKVRSQNHFVE